MQEWASQHILLAGYAGENSLQQDSFSFPQLPQAQDSSQQHELWPADGEFRQTVKLLVSRPARRALPQLVKGWLRLLLSIVQSRLPCLTTASGVQDLQQPPVLDQVPYSLVQACLLLYLRLESLLHRPAA